MNKRTFLSETPCRYDFRAAAEGRPEHVCRRTCTWLKGDSCSEPSCVCLMKTAIRCAKNAIEMRTTLFSQVRTQLEQLGFWEQQKYSGEFFPGTLTPKSFIWFDDEKPTIVTDATVVPRLIVDFAGLAMKGNTGTDIGSVVASSMECGECGPVLDLSKLQEYEGRFGYNGGQGCDVLDGPCSCGAWHHNNRLI